MRPLSSIKLPFTLYRTELIISPRPFNLARFDISVNRASPSFELGVFLGFFWRFRLDTHSTVSVPRMIHVNTRPPAQKRYKSNHASTIEVLPDGTLAAAWFSGAKEEVRVRVQIN